MRYLKTMACAALLLAQFAWAAVPAFEGKLARIRLLEAKVVPAPAGGGARESLRMVYFVARQEGVGGKLSLREPRDVWINGRSYREITRAEFARDFEPRTTVDDAAAFFRAQPTAAPEGIGTDGAFVIVVELFGAAVPKGSEVRSKLVVGFDGKTEPGEFTFTPDVP